MKIAITGSTGFIGSHLFKEIKSHKKHNVIVFQKNLHSLMDIESLYGLVKNADAVFHLASINNSEDPNLFKTNVLGTSNIIHAIRNAAKKDCKFIFTSSFSVYKVPKKQDIISEKSELSPQSLYGLSKKINEDTILFNSKFYGLKYVILRISNPYGPGVPPFKHSVIGTFIKSIQNNQQIFLHGKGTQTRDFVYIDDVISALTKSIDNRILNQTINIASGNSISINNLLKKIEKNVDAKANLVKVPNTKATGYWNVDISKAKKVLQWIPETDIIDGLKNTWMYFKSNEKIKGRNNNS